MSAATKSRMTLVEEENEDLLDILEDVLTELDSQGVELSEDLQCRISEFIELEDEADDQEIIDIVPEN